jgi:hypothetical protein
MLESFRKLERSWTTYVMFFIICAMFVVGYMPCIGQNLQTGATGATVANVGNHSIGHNLVNLGLGYSLERQGDQIYFQQNRSMFLYLGNGGFITKGKDRYLRITPEERILSVFNQSTQDSSIIEEEKIVNDLVEVYLVSDMARDLGLEVSNEELSSRIRGARAFQMEDGSFAGKRTYARQISRFSLAPDDFEQFFKRFILRERVVALYRAMHRASDREIKFYLDGMSNKIDLEFLRLDERPLAARLAPTLSEEAVAAFAEGHTKELEEAYKTPKHRLRYFTPEKMNLRAIWINPAISTDRDKDKAKEKVDTIQKEIDTAFQAGGGTPEALHAAFEAAARIHSDHIDSKENGGAFKDPRSKEQLARYPFGDEDSAELIFSAKPGSLVGPVETEYGFWLILAGDHTASITIPLEKVRLELARELLSEDTAKKQFESVVSEILTKAKADGAAGLDAVSAAWSKSKGFENNVFPSERTGAFGRIGVGPIPPPSDHLGYVPLIGVSPEMKQRAFNLTAEAPVASTAFALEGEQSRFLIRLHETSTDDEEAMKKLKSEIRDQLQLHNASVAYRGMVQDLFQKAQKTQNIYTNQFHLMRKARLKEREREAKQNRRDQ